MTTLGGAENRKQESEQCDEPENGLPPVSKRNEQRTTKGVALLPSRDETGKAVSQPWRTGRKMERGMEGGRHEIPSSSLAAVVWGEKVRAPS